MPALTAQTNIQMRPATADDYQALCDITNAVFPGYDETPQEWRYADEHRDPKCHRFRWITWADGWPVAFGDTHHVEELYHPRKLAIDVQVRPEWEARGIGSALYATAVAAARAFDPISLMAFSRDDRPRGVRFLEDRGFVEVMRDWESHLDLPSFDPAPFADAERRVLEQGIEIRPYPELAQDPDRDRKIWELDMEVSADMPAAEPYTPISFEA